MQNEKIPIYDKIEIFIIILLFTFMVAISGFTVFSRYLFSFTFSWAEQITRIMFVWITFAGISWAGLLGHHMRVNLLSKFLGKGGRYLMWAGDCITVLFGVYMAYKIFGVMSTIYKREQVFSAMPWMPVWIMYLAGVLGMLGLSIRTIQRNIRAIRSPATADGQTPEEMPQC